MTIKIIKANPYEVQMKPKALTSTPVEAFTTVSKKIKTGTGTDKEVLIKAESEILNKGLVVATNELYKLEVGAGMTVQLQPFEFARIDVKLTVPCIKSDLNEAYEWASDWVSEKVQTAVATAKGE